jgi:hypothetical protein
MSDLFTERQAWFSTDRKYRWKLLIRWGVGRMLVCVMLNPSVADETANDPTIERMERRARALGFGGLVVLNLFALVETNRLKMLQVEDPVGVFNDSHIEETMIHAAQRGWVVFVGWGNEGGHRDRHLEVLALMRAHGVAPVCLDTCANGQPKHPLYIGYDVAFKPWGVAA